MSKTNAATVTDYQLVTPAGRPIRKATKVVFADGKVVKFVDRFTSKRAAIAQALELIAKGAV